MPATERALTEIQVGPILLSEAQRSRRTCFLIRCGMGGGPQKQISTVNTQAENALETVEHATHRLHRLGKHTGRGVDRGDVGSLVVVAPVLHADAKMLADIPIQAAAIHIRRPHRGVIPKRRRPWEDHEKTKSTHNERPEISNLFRGNVIYRDFGRFARDLGYWVLAGQRASARIRSIRLVGWVVGDSHFVANKRTEDLA